MVVTEPAYTIPQDVPTTPPTGAQLQSHPFLLRNLHVYRWYRPKRIPFFELFTNM